MPVEKFYEAYFAGDLDLVGDIQNFLAHRQDFLSWKLTTGHFKWALTKFVPEVAIHSKSQDRRIVGEHYDRGNDFFGWFLGERMVYTSAFFHHPEESLEQGQDNKLDRVCQKLQLKPGDTLLDIGCGWGTLVRHAARHYGAKATGVTLSKNQVEYAAQRIAEDGLEDQVRVLFCDYREIPRGEAFDKIASLEMVEHVGVKNLGRYYREVYDLLNEDGLALIQWTGLRRAMRSEELVWGLFMSKYIFPGADASLCCFAMLKQMERTNFEIHSVENITTHYAITIKKWYDNWVHNKAAIVEGYGDRWFRIWHFFLAWSIKIAEQGGAACFQVVMNKNLDGFPRERWIGPRSSRGERVSVFQA